MELQSKLISNPELWTPETLILYKVVTSLVDTKTRKAIDEKSHKVGFRWFSFDGEKGFCLNGKSYKLRGFNRHQDQAPVGVAPHRRDIRLLKEMECQESPMVFLPLDFLGTKFSLNLFPYVYVNG